jgi:hypothetical protein
MIEPRQAVREFAVKMEEVLRRHDDRGGWENCQRAYLEDLINKHVEKAIAYPCSGDEKSQRNWIDVANIAMMLYEHCIGGETGRINGINFRNPFPVTSTERDRVKSSSNQENNVKDGEK